MDKKIIKYLEKNKIKHEIVKHKKVYTAYDAAQTLHLPLKEIVKCLLLKLDGKNYALALVGADKKLDLKKIAKIAKVKKAEIPSEKIMKKFEKNGHISCFGSLYEVPVFIDKNLTKAKKAIFPAGSFTESLKISVKDYIKLEKPTIGVFSAKKK